MGVYYNITNMTSATNIASFVSAVDAQSGYYLGTSIFITLNLLFFLVLKMNGNNTLHSLSATSFIGVILALLMRSMNFLSDKALFITVIIAGICAFFIFSKG